MKKPLMVCGLNLAIAVAAFPAAAADTPEVKLTWGGYIKLDTLYSRFSDGAVAQGIGRDTYIPNQIPVVADDLEDSRSYLDFHAKETRLFLKANTQIEGHKLGGMIEIDFIVNQGMGNETATNAYNPGLRRAFLTFDNWLLGEEWSTFQNLKSLPDALDFVTFPTDGTVFVRQPIVRYTTGGLMLSVENPETTVALNDGGPAFANTDESNVVPDFIARYNFKLGGADLAFAALARQLVNKGAVGGISDKAMGYGATLSGQIPLGARDDIRFAINGGDGIGRYLALNTVGDAVIDGNGKLNTIRIINGYVALHHPWTERTRSNLGVSHLDANTDNGDLGGAATQKASSAFINLLYSPVSALTVGAEYRYGGRETVAGLDGNLHRLQFSAKYSF